MKILKIAAFALPLLVLASCEEDIVKSDYNELPSGQDLASAETQNVKYNFGIGAVVNIKATPSSNPVGEEYGVICSEKQEAVEGNNPNIANPEVSVMKATSLDADGSATVAINDLEDGKTYYYRAFAYNGRGITFGDDIKHFTADESLSEYRKDFAVNFNDMTGADADLFTTVQFGEEETADPFTPVPLALLGLNRWGYASTLFDVDKLFNAGSGEMIAPVDNVLVYEADFSGKYFPQLNLTVLNLCSLFGAPKFSGNFEVRVSANPIESQEDYEQATKLGEGIFPTDATAPDYQFKDFSFSIPGKFNGATCYIAIKNSSYYSQDGNGNEVGNWGLVITGYNVSSRYLKNL